MTVKALPVNVLNVYRNGELYTSIGDPYQLESWAIASNIDPAELTMNLQEVKDWKEVQIRNLGDAWYQENVLSFEGTMVAMKIARGQNLNDDEAAVRDLMAANNQTIRTKRAQIRQANRVEDALAVFW